ncbi:MAG: YicC family protein [Saprospiraceae bacterium]|nr:YicC family protein [Saprospiraceae bacterium]
MTGFGNASGSHGNKKITVEIRSLNSKYTDLRYKIPPAYRDVEAELRKILTEHCQRGKIELSIDINSPDGDDEYGLNLELYKKYYRELKSINEELGQGDMELTEAIIRIPNVISTSNESLDPGEWASTKEVLKEALKKFSSFRETEGEAMMLDCKHRIQSIMDHLSKVEPFETNRVAKLRQRIQKNMEEYVGKDNIDANRFEQEILYYLEKIDVTEEKVRLSQHCKYFLEVLGDNKLKTKGKKLNFISQEIGREINTLGSKANDSNIQQLVVGMKDELEKIKEQVLNTI